LETGTPEKTVPFRGEVRGKGSQEGVPVPEYEIQVAGPIGPVVASSLPGFSFLTVPPGTILAGTVAGPDELLGVIGLLDGHGLALTDLWLSHGQ
jgi:hypothetical protein